MHFFWLRTMVQNYSEKCVLNLGNLLVSLDRIVSTTNQATYHSGFVQILFPKEKMIYWERFWRTFKNRMLLNGFYFNKLRTPLPCSSTFLRILPWLIMFAIIAILWIQIILTFYRLIECLCCNKFDTVWYALVDFATFCTMPNNRKKNKIRKDDCHIIIVKSVYLMNISDISLIYKCASNL